ncbi:MAG: hypothetical protein WAS23_15095 [Dokdonella sp.]|uniref:hypothetical protein n=1 Tax=Dokdonella sp. TaxID=2291710 RepID=UPI002C3C328A|nr:hypothetical protein [Dokdonella sp.]HOX72523.1 hypothetical protein [Dokdonella sp.]HPG93625.1 hypothetical protein [Dokdonella sp.]HPN79693.1 hypothetical protein [Dokdonella sp.]
MLVTTVFVAAAVLSAGRFGPNNQVTVETVGNGARITAYGDTQVVKIQAEDFEVSDCIEVFNDGLHPGRCMFSEGGLITLSRDPSGTRITFQDAGKGNTVEYVTNLAGRKQAAKAMTP